MPGAQPGRGVRSSSAVRSSIGWPPSADQCHIASAGEDPVGGYRAGQSRFVRQRRPTATTVTPAGRKNGRAREGRVENTFFRYTSIIGDGLRARSPAGQGSEAVLGCEILNRMTALGRPVPYCIGR